MRKNLVAQGIAVLIGGLALAGVANAQVIVPVTAAGTVNGVPFANNLAIANGDIGHINIIPYYTVQSGNDTYFNIINADTRNGKAVKVRFRGASNSDDVFDITVLMSPGDSWAAAVTRGADGLPVLRTSDRTCTLPGAVGTGSGTPFVTVRLDSTLTGDALANEAREGYVEILNMADIPPVLAVGATGTAGTPTAATAPGATNPLFTAIKHVNGVPPCAGTSIDALGTRPTTFGQASDAGLAAPTTGLMTSWVVINVPRTKSFSGNAVAVVARQGTDESSPAGYGNIVFFPQTPTPIAGAENFTSDPLFLNRDATGVPVAAGTAGSTGNLITALSFDFPDLSTPYFVTTATPAAGATAVPVQGEVVTSRQQAQELSQSLAVSSVSNEYVTDPVVLGKTDWVFAMPTRRYSVAFNYAGTAAGPNTATGRLQFTDLSLTGVTPTSGSLDRDFFTAGNTTVVGRQICVNGISTVNAATTPEPANRVNGVTADREERFLQATNDFVVSPGAAAAPLTFCGEVSVLSFNASTTSSGLTGSVLGATVARKDVTFGYANGWLRLATPGLALPNATGTAGTPPTAGTPGTPFVTARGGLPIVGSAMIELFNSAVSTGFSGGFGVTLPHRTTRPVVTPQ